MSRLKLVLSQPVYIVTSLAAKGLLNWVPDKIYLKIIYRGLTGEKLNIKNPKSYNEKMQWLKIYDHKDIYSKLVDKYEVKQFVSDKIGDSYIIPTLGVWNHFDEIDFSTLPDQFVLKCTHDSGSIFICKDKKGFPYQDVKAKMEKALKRSYYKTYREWPYKNVKPRIIAEKFMVDELEDDLKDYKIMCFNGIAKLIEIHANRFSKEKEHTQTFYDREWNKLSITQGDMNVSEDGIERPACLERMLELSEILALNIPHVRVDWYVINNKIYFGEMTFYDGSGLEPFNDKKDDEMLGDWIQL